MAAAVRRYDLVCNAQWRRSRALVEATGRRHWASKTCRKGLWVDAEAPVFNMGMTYQTKEKGLTKVSILVVGGRGVRLVE
jgi:hypothetical protein